MENNSSERIKRKFIKALKAFMESEPLDRISVTEIVNACEVTRPTFYRYFKRKEDVILYYFEHNTKEFIFGRRFYTVAFVSRI